MTEAILALNAGSSSIKFGLFETVGGAPRLLAKGVVEDLGPTPRLVAKGPGGEVIEERSWDGGAAHGAVLGALLDWTEAHLGGDTLAGVGHRIVHGGRAFTGPVRLDASAIAAIDRLTPLAPLHQPRSLEPIRALAALRPGLLQVGCFDTAFHHGLAPPVSRYAIPRHLEADGIRKYGFHGLSYEYIAGKLAELSPGQAAKRTIVAHLGNGASLCALQHGRSLDTTMGFTALDGLIMGTRCGALDPGVVLYLQQAQGLSAKAVEDLLYHQSGLLGVSGLSGDVRTLSESRDPHAAEALDLFGFRAARETAALANTLGGLECLVFTGGVGEHSADVRARICTRLAWLGVGLAAEPGPDGAIGSGPVDVRIIPTDEEVVIARQVLQIRAAS